MQEDMAYQACLRKILGELRERAYPFLVEVSETYLDEELLQALLII